MLNEINWPKTRTYETNSEHEPGLFYINCLINSTTLDLKLGYFSSSAINLLSIGFATFLYKGGKVRIIINDILYKNDKEAIDRGKKGLIDDDIIDLKNLKSLEKTLSKGDQLFFDCLAWLIKKERIEFIVIKPKNNLGVSHYKSGIFSDGELKIGFKATCNFSATALLYNLEELTVIDPRDNELSEDQLFEYENNFNKIFNKLDNKIEYVDIKNIKEAIQSISNDKEINDLIYDQKKLLEDKKNYLKFISDDIEKKIVEEIIEYDKRPVFPYSNGPRAYQKDAYIAWEKNGKCGVFAMATGTGKTITSLNCLLEVYKETKKYQALILAPTITLVNQWKEEVNNFNFTRVLTIHSKSKWKTDLPFFLANARRNNSSFIIISTYASFTSNAFRNYIPQLPESTLFIADEAHNIGSTKITDSLKLLKLEKRIGLSATPKRAYDPEGTDFISDYFSDKPPYVYSYSMRKAISNENLCKYNYYPHIVTLEEDEMEAYKEITKKLARAYDGENNVKGKQTRREKLLLERKRIIHKAKNKLAKTLEILRYELQKRGNLKYCFIYVPEGFNEAEYAVDENLNEDKEEARIINQYTKSIHSIDDSITTSQFISGIKERDQLLDQFKNGDIDILVSMKCLDEGVDVPRAELAIFCSSTGNPRQFIQRRGRVLRTHHQKKMATIHDLVVVPTYNASDKKNFETEKKLVKSELERVMYFASLSENTYYSEDVFKDICNHYNLNLYTIFKELDHD